MLQIKNISKTYKTGDLIQKALDNVSLNLRDNEFVAVLGPSGSGKTTLLNIIGGLDRYDDGDLIINNVSTKNYKDRDWDTYRNHTIGFVFQSYNLIPHQNILSNVELALTIGGISRKERRQRALNALDEVGLKDQAHKKPNQMSGGQMQRVAIARALVNNPDILLADEPTGALDSKTSIQVMELLKKVAQDRLVVMVTHNPELANEYANRIVNLKDGVILSDSNPLLIEDMPLNEKVKKVKKAHMSFLTALSLSLNNLLTKKGRTILTAFAGSIGIIGIALILALSTGFQNYIDKIQEDTMSSYPLTIQSETTNVFGAILSSRISSDEEIEENTVREQMLITSMMNSVGSNDLKSFKTWLENNEDKYEGDLTNITYAYSVTPRIFTKDVTDSIVQLNPSTVMSSIYSDSAMSVLSSLSASSSMGIFTEYDIEKVKENVELLKGEWPSAYNEVIIVLSDKDKISDLLVYSLGLRDNAELKSLITDVMSGEETKIKNEPMTFTYDDLLKVELKLVDTSDLYKYNAKYSTYEDMTSDKEYMETVYKNSESLKITGIAYSTNNSSSIAGIIYSHDLIEHVIDVASKSELVRKQLSNKDVDVFSGNSFDEKNKKEALDFNDMVSIDENMLKNAFKVNISKDDLNINTLDGDKMMDIATNTAKQIEQIDQIPSREQLTNLFAVINSYILNSYLNDYEADANNYIEIDSTKYLNINDYDAFIENNINGTTYKAKLETMLALLPTEVTSGISIDQLDGLVDYDALAKDIKKMFNDFYTRLREGSYGLVEDKYIIRTILLPNQTIIYGIEDTVNDPPLTVTIDRNSLAYEVVSDAKNIKETTNIINTIAKIKEEGPKGLVLQAMAQSMMPLVNSLQGLGDIFNNMISIDTKAFAKAFNFDMDEDEVSRLMQSMLTSSNASYSNNLINLGYQDLDDPTSISLYFTDFDSKEHFLTVLDEYNETVNDEDKEIKYTDITGLLMSSVQTIINAVTYVLIAFVSISLVVSSIMIAVITLISVMERTKEIGILRAMGASKKNVSSIFSAETFIIGLLSGVLGVTVSWLLTIPINNIIHALTDNYDINAILEIKPAIVLVIISIGLTIFAGFIPSKKAAKQDPVIALRTE